MKPMGQVCVTVVVFLLTLGGGAIAWGTPLVQDQLAASPAHILPYYNVVPGHAAFLVLHAGPSGDDVAMRFFDQTCALRTDFFVELSDFDTFTLDLEDGFKEATGIPLEGALLLTSPTPFYASLFNVDLLQGTASMWPSIPLNTQVGDWLVYDRQVILPDGPTDNDLPFSSVVTLSCPQKGLADAMVALVGGGGLFEANSGLLDIFVFDTDETFLGSIHNVACRCFERNRLRDWVPHAATQDVVVYFQDAANAVSTAGFQEILFQGGGLKLFLYSYLNHSGDFFGGGP